MSETKYINREISWNHFNYRVLQEAKDPDVPLYERIKFLSIFSSNLDEYFRVRIASIRLLIKEKNTDGIDFNPKKLLKSLYSIIDKQQIELGKILRESIFPELRALNINFSSIDEIDENEKSILGEYFDNYIFTELTPRILIKNKLKIFLKNRKLYLGVVLEDKRKNQNSITKRINHKYAILEIPSDILNRFIDIRVQDNNSETETNSLVKVFMLDDVIRLNLYKLFPEYNICGAYSMKLNRDAELYLGDEFSGNILTRIKASLNKRELGVPSRFLYDPQIQSKFLNYLRNTLELSKSDLFPGGKYHNFFDFIKFPNYDKRIPKYESIEQLKSSHFERFTDIFEAIDNDDILLNYPYYSYDYLLDFIRFASEDKGVKTIKITLYRIAENSEIVSCLIKAAKKGKEVVVFVELKSRFDESNNIYWAEEMEKAGAKVIYSIPGIKVHSKILLIIKEKNRVKRFYSYLSTGNFNEKTALFYVDFGFFTANQDICREVEGVFRFIETGETAIDFKHLLVGQFNLRRSLEGLFDEQINLKNVKNKEVILKLNNLEDKKMIKKIIEAAESGIKVRIIVRSVCCLNPSQKKINENIEVISIVDKYLEHSRVYIFRNDSYEKVYLSSSDFMKRNLNRRVETAFPIYSKKLKKEISEILELYLSDNTKARIIDEEGRNLYKTNEAGRKIHAQKDLYEFHINKEGL